MPNPLTPGVKRLSALLQLRPSDINKYIAD